MNYRERALKIKKVFVPKEEHRPRQSASPYAYSQLVSVRLLAIFFIHWAPDSVDLVPYRTGPYRAVPYRVPYRTVPYLLVQDSRHPLHSHLFQRVQILQ